jgi:hypothetical protein
MQNNAALWWEFFLKDSSTANCAPLLPFSDGVLKRVRRILAY